MLRPGRKRMTLLAVALLAAVQPLVTIRNETPKGCTFRGAGSSRQCRGALLLQALTGGGASYAADTFAPRCAFETDYTLALTAR